MEITIFGYCIGMFVIGEALEESGYLSHLSYKMFSKAKTINSLLLQGAFRLRF